MFKKNKEGLAGTIQSHRTNGDGRDWGGHDLATRHRDQGIDGRKRHVDTTVRSTATTIPFIKDNHFDYAWLLSWLMDDAAQYVWVVFIPLVILIVTAVSNGANLTDGIDGLATGTSAIIGMALAVLAYVSSNTVIADYLSIMYIPGSEELVVFIAAFVGACVAFLWYNAFPAQVFMGDTGSLALGGIIATFAIAIRKELLIPVLCGIFLIENLSVVHSSGVVPVHQKEIRRRPSRVPHGTPSPPLPKAKHARVQNHRSVLDRRHPPRRHHHRHPESPLISPTP